MEIQKYLKNFEDKLYFAVDTGKIDKYAFNTVNKRLDQANNLVEQYMSKEIDMVTFNQKLINMNDYFVDYSAIASTGTVLKRLLMELSTAIINYARVNLDVIQMLNE